MRLKESAKWMVYGSGLAITFLPAATCWLEERVSQRADLFRFWAHLHSLVPGLLGDYLRKCFYRLTLESCSLTCKIGFLTQFTHPGTVVGERVHVGGGSRIGTATLGDGSLIGSRVSILSGSRQHEYDATGVLTPFDVGSAERVTVGVNTWIGEGAILMADVGNRCIVSAGAVVSQPIPDGSIVAGNPCRFVGKTPVPEQNSDNNRERGGESAEKEHLARPA